VKAAAVRLALCAALFAGWIGYLGYLAYLAAAPRNQVVLSRPQFLVSDVDIVGTALDEPNKVHVEEVLYPAEGWAALKDQTITIDNLDKCRVPDGRGWKEVGRERYLLPLSAQSRSQGESDHRHFQFKVAAVPPSPGFHGGDDCRVYPDGDEARRQYSAVAKPR